MKQNIRHIAFWRVWTIALLLTFTAQQVALAQSPLGEETKQPRMALRTNLLYDATLSPNLGVDVRVDSAWTVGLLVGINAWDIDKEKNKKWRHALFSIRARKYRDSLFHKGYYEADVIYSHYNVGNTKIPFGLYSAVKDRRLQGDLVALGAKYGYSWILSRTWRIEAEAGVAVGYAWFKEYDCDHCGTYYGKGDRIFLLPQLGINVVYIIN
ncbi:MAG: DUF3575 domain-containing protein [Prevotella sp.]|nr:DUF3575 domain-containing protein [Prevotella sp.]